MATASAAARRAADASAVSRVPRREVDVAPPGHAETIEWASVPGATDVEVGTAKATIGSALVSAVQELPVSVASDGNSRDIAVPSGARVLSLGLTRLKWIHTVQPEGEDPKEARDHLDSESALRNVNVRLVVSTPDARGQMAPVYAIPQVGRQGALPPQFGGASYGSSSLAVHGLKAPKVRVMLTEDIGKPPHEWSPAAVECDTVSASVGRYPAALELEGSDGATLWAFPAEMTDDIPDADVDIAAPVRGALVKALKAKEALRYAMTLRGNGDAKAHFELDIRGAVVRSFASDVGATLEGEERAFALDGDALAAEVPTGASADVSILYAGIRVLDEVCDAVPAPGGATGAALTDRAAHRALPRAALAGLPVVRVGIVGRAPEPCELSLQLVEMRGDVPGPAYGDPGTVSVAPSMAFGIHWIELPPHRPLGASVALALRATSGRFFWVRQERFLARVAVADPNPGGRAVRVAGKPFVLPNEAPANAKPGKSAAASRPVEKRYDWKGTSLPAAAFAGGTPFVSSLLFATVNVRDLTLRYARSLRT